MQKKSIIQNASLAATLAVLIASCGQNASEKSSTEDSSTMQTPAPVNVDSGATMRDTTRSMEDTATKSDQVPPPKN
jgi:hypothetical protein